MERNLRIGFFKSEQTDNKCYKSARDKPQTVSGEVVWIHSPVRKPALDNLRAPGHYATDGKDTDYQQYDRKDLGRAEPEGKKRQHGEGQEHKEMHNFVHRDAKEGARHGRKARKLRKAKHGDGSYI